MQSNTLNKPNRSKKPKRINVALDYKHHRLLKRYARQQRCNFQQAAEQAVELLPTSAA